MNKEILLSNIDKIHTTDNKTIFSSEYKLHMPTEQELITAVEEVVFFLIHKRK